MSNKKAVLALSACITIAQVLMMFAVQPTRTKNNPPYAYSRLFQWDSEHYQSITDNGYTEQSAAFFPAYPIASMTLAQILPSKYALILTAQLACWIFWYYFITILFKWKMPVALSVSLVIAHPASFYLVSAYSEPVFCAALMSFIFGVYHSKTVTAFISGVILGLTRIVGVPMAVLPLILSRTRAASLAPLLGMLLFFAYLHIQFGFWDQYFIAQNKGWNLEPNYLFFLNMPMWLVFPWAFEPNWYIDYTGATVSIDVNVASRWIAAITLYLLTLATIFGNRIITLCAWGFFYISLAGVLDNDLQSFIRYALVIHILIVLALAHRLKSYWWWIVPICSFPVMIYYANKFVEGAWVA